MVTGEGSDGRRGTVTRRALLASGAAAGTSLLAGCQGAVGRLREEVSGAAVTNSAATPAAFYGGSSQPERTHPERGYDVREAGLAVSGEFAGRSVDTTLRGYVTRSTLRVNNHNTTRSNRIQPASVGDPDGDTGTLVGVLELHRGLALLVEAALGAADGESTAGARRALTDLTATFEDVAGLVGPAGTGCPTESCEVLRRNADANLEATAAARSAVEAGEWDRATRSLRTVGRTVAADTERLEAALGEDVLGAADGLYAYLDGEATVGERFVLTVPDARLRGSDAAPLEALTPGRLLRYVTGETVGPDTDDGRFRWVDGPPRLSASITVPDTDSYDPNAQLVALGYCTGGNGENFNVTVGVGGASLVDPDGDGDADGSGVVGAEDGFTVLGPEGVAPFDWGELTSWGPERDAGEARATPVVVGSVLAQPADCPGPMPALLYCRRIRHADQYVYTGGWVVDDGSLYHDAVTLLVAEALPEVVGVEHGAADAMRRAIEEGLERPRGRFGSLLYDGPLDERALAFLPPPHREEAGRAILAERAMSSVRRLNPATGRELTVPLDGRSRPDADPLLVTVCPLDCPVVHVDVPAGCRSCRSENCDCTTNLVPAVNTISSR